MELLTVTVSGMVVSVLTSLFKTAKLNASQRSALALGLSLVGGLATVLMSTDLNGSVDIVKMAVATFASSQIVYTGVLKNSGINTKIEAIDLFTAANKKKVEELAHVAEEVIKKSPVAKPPASKKAPAKKAVKKSETK